MNPNVSIYETAFDEHRNFLWKPSGIGMIGLLSVSLAVLIFLISLGVFVRGVIQKKNTSGQIIE